MSYDGHHVSFKFKLEFIYRVGLYREARMLASILSVIAECDSYMVAFLPCLWVNMLGDLLYTEALVPVAVLRDNLCFHRTIVGGELAVNEFTRVELRILD